MAKPNPVAPKTTTAAKFGPGILRGEKCGLNDLSLPKTFAAPLSDQDGTRPDGQSGQPVNSAAHRGAGDSSARFFTVPPASASRLCHEPSCLKPPLRFGRSLS